MLIFLPFGNISAKIIACYHCKGPLLLSYVKKVPIEGKSRGSKNRAVVFEETKN